MLRPHDPGRVFQRARDLAGIATGELCLSFSDIRTIEERRSGSSSSMASRPE
jgi:hypothetical protein